MILHQACRVVGLRYAPCYVEEGTACKYISPLDPAFSRHNYHPDSGYPISARHAIIEVPRPGGAYALIQCSGKTWGNRCVSLESERLCGVGFSYTVTLGLRRSWHDLQVLRRHAFSPQETPIRPRPVEFSLKTLLA